MITREAQHDIRLGISLACFVILAAVAIVAPPIRFMVFALGVVGLDVGYGIGRRMR